MWVRLVVDLDEQGNPCGTSYEVHGTDGPTTVRMLPYGPFDTPAELIAAAQHEALQDLGTQLLLF